MRDRFGPKVSRGIFGDFCRGCIGGGGVCMISREKGFSEWSSFGGGLGGDYCGGIWTGSSSFGVLGGVVLKYDP